MIVVSDTSPITSLLTIGRIDLLEKIYGQVVIPAAVATELARMHTELPSFICVREVLAEVRVRQLSSQLDRGEAEAIVLATELHADLLLIDEELGRTVARAEGLRIVGVAGVLLVAKRRRYILSVGEILTQLKSEAHFFLSQSVRDHTLRLAGEDHE